MVLRLAVFADLGVARMEVSLTELAQDFTLDLTHGTGLPQNLALKVPPTVDVLVDYGDLDGFALHHDQFSVVVVRIHGRPVT